MRRVIKKKKHSLLFFSFPSYYIIHKPLLTPNSGIQNVRKQSFTLWRSITELLFVSSFFASKLFFPQLRVWKLSRRQRGGGVVTGVWHVNLITDSSRGSFGGDIRAIMCNNGPALECGGRGAAALSSHVAFSFEKSNSKENMCPD